MRRMLFVVALIVATSTVFVTSSALAASPNLRPIKANLACIPAVSQGVVTGVDCTVYNFQNHSIKGTFSSDAGTAPLTITVAPRSTASYNVGFSVSPGTDYHFYWNSPGISLSTDVQL